MVGVCEAVQLTVLPIDAYCDCAEYHDIYMGEVSLSLRVALPIFFFCVIQWFYRLVKNITILLGQSVYIYLLYTVLSD